MVTKIRSLGFRGVVGYEVTTPRNAAHSVGTPFFLSARAEHPRVASLAPKGQFTS